MGWKKIFAPVPRDGQVTDLVYHYQARQCECPEPLRQAGHVTLYVAVLLSHRDAPPSKALIDFSPPVPIERSAAAPLRLCRQALSRSAREQLYLTMSHVTRRTPRENSRKQARLCSANNAFRLSNAFKLSNIEAIGSLVVA
jgi:hypothetical protein